jgi:hypothetical protein
MAGSRGRPTRAPTIFGAILMLLGAGLYFIDITDTGRNLHWFVVPALALMGLGALFTTLGQRQRHPD